MSFGTLSEGEPSRLNNVGHGPYQRDHVRWRGLVVGGKNDSVNTRRQLFYDACPGAEQREGSDQKRARMQASRRRASACRTCAGRAEMNPTEAYLCGDIDAWLPRFAVVGRRDLKEGRGRETLRVRRRRVWRGYVT